MSQYTNSLDYKYKHSTRLSLHDTHRMEHYCSNNRINVDDFIRDAICQTLDRVESNAFGSVETPDMKISKFMRTKEERDANLLALIEYRKVHSESEYQELRDDLDFSEEDVLLYEETMPEKKSTLRVRCECFVRGVLTALGDVDSMTLRDMCEEANYSQAVAKQAIDSVSDYRKDGKRSIRFLKGK
jgi:hypothetical protein